MPILEAVLTRVTGRSSAILSETSTAVSCVGAGARTLERAQVEQEDAMLRTTAIDPGSLGLHLHGHRSNTLLSCLTITMAESRTRPARLCVFLHDDLALLLSAPDA